jgi:hypothetical protein
MPYWPASICSLTGRYDNPIVFFVPSAGDYELGLWIESLKAFENKELISKETVVQIVFLKYILHTRYCAGCCPNLVPGSPPGDPSI